MGQYYSESLSAERLKRCYDIAPPRIRQYLEAEVDFVRKFISPKHRVLELGCGYGRILPDLSSITPFVSGIDISLQSLRYDQVNLHKQRGLSLVQMGAQNIGFQDKSFDTVVCIQNGISAFKVNSVDLVRESLRVTDDGGRSLFSTYSDKIWEDRLEWFRLQAEENLLGEIDWDKTQRGTIVCKDGFVATTFSEVDFRRIANELGVSCDVLEVDSSSLFAIFS